MVGCTLTSIQQCSPPFSPVCRRRRIVTIHVACKPKSVLYTALRLFPEADGQSQWTRSDVASTWCEQLYPHLTRNEADQRLLIYSGRQHDDCPQTTRFTLSQRIPPPSRRHHKPSCLVRFPGPLYPNAPKLYHFHGYHPLRQAVVFKEAEVMSTKPDPPLGMFRLHGARLPDFSTSQDRWLARITTTRPRSCIPSATMTAISSTLFTGACSTR